MSVSTHLERAESALRRALINALAEGEDHLLQDLYENLQSVMDLNKKTKMSSGSLTIQKIIITTKIIIYHLI